MPVYLLHGFRWSRKDIRIRVVLSNIDDASPDWLQGPRSSGALIANFRKEWPEIMDSLPNLRFIEQYDPLDDRPQAMGSQPFVYVADKVEVCGLSLDASEAMGRGVGTEAWGALAELRDILAAGAKVGWWVVYNGDEERLHSKDDGEGNGSISVWLLLLEMGSRRYANFPH